MSVEQRTQVSPVPNSIYNLPNLNPQNNSSLHISGLPFETTEEDIVLFFRDYRLISVKLIK